MATSPLYERDFYAWTQQQAQLLKAGRLVDVDLDNLIEEIESMGASQRRELLSRLVVLLHHLLKWQYQPVQRSSGWHGTITEQRSQLDILLDQSPSLRSQCDEGLLYAYPRARRAAALETGLTLSVFPESCPYALEDVLRPEFFPD